MLARHRLQARIGRRGAGHSDEPNLRGHSGALAEKRDRVFLEKRANSKKWRGLDDSAGWARGSSADPDSGQGGLAEGAEGWGQIERPHRPRGNIAFVANTIAAS